MPIDVGQYIQELRRAAGLTQAQLAARIGAQQSEVASWEAGRTVPTGTTLLAMQQAAPHDQYRHPHSVTMGKAVGAWESYIAMIDCVCEGPISDVDRDELGVIKDELHLIRLRINDILGRHDAATLDGPFDPFAPTPSPALRCLLGFSEDNDPVDVDLDRTPHGIVVIGHTSHDVKMPGGLLTSVAGRLGRRNPGLEVWLVRLLPADWPSEPWAPITLTVEHPAQTLPQAAAAAIRAYVELREEQLGGTGAKHTAGYWKLQSRNPGGVEQIPRVFLQINDFQALIGHEEFDRQLLETLAKADTLGIHVQLCATEIPDDQKLGELQDYLSYRALLKSSPHTVAQVLSDSVGHDINAALDEPGVGVVFTPGAEPAMILFRRSPIF